MTKMYYDKAALYRSCVAGHMKKGKCLAFSHGFNIHFGQIVPPQDIDVYMVAPKTPGIFSGKCSPRGAVVPA